MSLADALSRTTRLINQEFFDAPADEEAIAEGLASTTVRLVANEANTSTRAGQAVLVTTAQLIARTGIQIELIVPDIALVTDVPPLRRQTLKDALLELSDDLIPGIDMQAKREHADVTFSFGDTPCGDANAVYISVSELGCRLTKDPAQAARIECEVPLGALAAAAAAAAIVMEAALGQIEDAANVTRSSRTRPSPGPPVELDLARLFPNLDTHPHVTGRIDVISGGAVANAFLATWIWLPHGLTDLRVLDDDVVALDNLNRCLQFRASDAAQGRAKVEALTDSTTPLMQIRGVPERFTEANRADLLPFAERVLVGVDDVTARWRVQESQPANLYIGATTNKEAILTTHHPGEPCAGCAHPDPLSLDDGEFVPTISFVSFWAGLLQSCALLSEAAQGLPARRITVYPFALGETAWGSAVELPGGARCALECVASGGSQAA
jgi:hypothetical protein